MSMILAATAALAAAAPMQVQAKGCVRGAVAGAVAGHYAGHHAVAGAMAGCVAARAYYAHKAKADAAKAPPTAAQHAH